MKVEILYFEGCPNYRAARALVERAGSEVGVETELELIEVPDPESAQRLRFLGSPTIRVDGRDVEPGAERRSDFVLACRVYRLAAGLAGLPDEGWLRERFRAG